VIQTVIVQCSGVLCDAMIVILRLLRAKCRKILLYSSVQYINILLRQNRTCRIFVFLIRSTVVVTDVLSVFLRVFQYLSEYLIVTV